MNQVHDPTSPLSQRRPLLLAASLIVMLTGSATMFVVRGPARAIGDGYDWAMVYAGARTWLHGGNPYSRDEALAQLAAGGSATHGRSQTTEFNLLYPPTGYALLAPLGAMDYSSSLWAWLVINLVATAGLIAAVLALNDMPWRSNAACVVTALILIMAPLHTGFAKGQTALVATTLGMAALVATTRQRPGLGGVLVGLAIALKPQLGAAFMVPALLMLNVSQLVTAGMTLGVVTAAAIVPLHFNAPTWLADLQANLDRFMTAGAGNPSPGNPASYQLINLHHPLHVLVDHRGVVSAVTWAVSIAAVITSAVLFGRHERRSARTCGVLVVSVWAAALLMCTYHRAYDAIVLALPLGWAVANLPRRAMRMPAGIVLGLIALFFWPGPAVLHVAAVRGWLPAGLTAAGWWRAIVVPHQAWAILGVTIALLWAMVRASAIDAAEATAMRRQSSP